MAFATMLLGTVDGATAATTGVALLELSTVTSATPRAAIAAPPQSHRELRERGVVESASKVISR
ncbi:MAG TPA: hypothetical protein PLG60_05595 [Acidimicrobiales bacterium]|nr:hypothetical protein [Acidimicrobiales bacterium]